MKKKNTTSKPPKRTNKERKPKATPKARAKTGSVRAAKPTASAARGRERNVFEREHGPRGWLFPLLESAYTKLVPRGQPETPPRKARGRATAAPAASAAARGGFRSRLQPGSGDNVLAGANQDFWLERVREYRQRKAAAAGPRAALRAAGIAPLPGPMIPGQKNWAPLGPSVVMNGQAHGRPAVGGRVSGIAVAPGGQIIYAASANGGVFRSDDAGQSWRSLMDAFDLDPTNYAATSLACGAIAIDPNDPARIYVGTGEGDTHEMFIKALRILNALPAYRGIGAIRSDDGGATWHLEPTTPSSPTLAGKAFFALVVDPANRENVFGATTEGLYQRILQPGAEAVWIQRRTGVHSSVVVASGGGTTRFIAAEWGRGVFASSNGTQWSTFGTGFPASDVGRIALGVQPGNPNLVYAFISKPGGAVLGVYRLDGSAGAWKKIANPPAVMPSPQGDYDLAIAVDPADANLIYLGGSYYHDNQYWPASVWRCRVRPQGLDYRFATGDPIGRRAHADVHVLMHTPGDPNALWVGCDGGVFLNLNPRASDNFGSRNTGLACLCPTFFAQHPTDPNILFCGLQDNGTARTRGGSVWKYVNGGDGGYCAINWADPRKVLVFANGTIYRTTDGTQDDISWSAREFPWAMMTEPIVGAPYNPAQPGEAEIVALASAQSIGGTYRPTVYLSNDFGANWPTKLQIPGSAGLYSLAFASASRFFVGTAAGDVFRVDRSGNSWTPVRLDNAAAGPLGLRGLIADIGVDWTDASLASIYVAFGGLGDARRVWYFDGTRWEVRSGPAGAATGNLLDVEHNAIVVDRAAPDHVYVGADIGVWHSPNRGQTWEPMPNGLPDAPVFDLQIHPTRRLLRAATHGRGLYEFALDPAPAPAGG